ncbi:MAG: hypothetical protein A2075_09265 [Geobacteraceae bacterium GWC2_58_44]|nr:MAG: hypothetical protein A2075_09265 [Geobacteraceae bacterium GWC2_58_44]HBG07702.1 hypothetical protein [Geobacter sp.]
MTINEEMLKRRMMRGALAGPVEAETRSARYCKGKLDNGRPCNIVMLGDEDYCLRHKREIEALEAGAPLPVGRLERPSKEKIAMSKKGTCKVCKKTDTHIVGAGMCYLCRKEAIAAGTYPEPANIVPVKPEPVEKKLTDVIIDAAEEKALQADGPLEPDMGLGDAPENLAQAPASRTADTDHLAFAGKEIDLGTVAPPHQEVADPPCSPVSVLSRLLRKLEPAIQPLPHTSIVLDFTEDEFFLIINSELTAQDIKDLTLLLVAGELGRVVEVEDPCAKSRHAAG